MTNNFCGQETLWNASLFMSSPWPRVTECFQLSVLVWLPCGWLWLSLAHHLYFLFRRHQGVAIATNKVNVAKIVCSGVLSVLTVTQFSWRQHQHDAQNATSMPPVVYLAFGLSLASYVLTILLIHLERMKGLVTSHVLWAFWFLSVMTQIIPFYSNICIKEYKSDSVSFCLRYVKFFCLCVQLVLATLVDKQRRVESTASPELTASVPSKLFFWWITRFLLKTFRKGIQEDDIFDLHPRDKAAKVVAQFELPWQQELERYQTSAGHLSNGHDSYSSFEQIKSQNKSGSFEFGESTPLIGRASRSVSTNENGRADTTQRPSLFKVLVKTYAIELTQSHFFMLTFDLLQFANPLLLGVLIHHVQERRESGESTREWPAYVISLGFFVAGVLSSVTLNQCYHLGMTFGMRVKDALIAAVYKKSLRMGVSPIHKTKMESTVKLMAVDCQRMQDLMAYLWMVWSAPLEILVSTFLLWRVVGACMLWGVLVMVILMPTNAYLAYRQRGNLADLARVKRRRIKLTKELTESIQVFKMFTWERYFQLWIERLRTEEIKILRKGFLMNAISTLFWSCSPFLVLLATFASRVMSSESPPLDAYQVFVSLALFNILRFPVNLLPMLATLLYQGASTVKRLSKFLTSEEIADTFPNVQPQNEFAIEIDRGHFTWDKTFKTSALSSIDLRIPRGHLVGVVGPPSSGKSSLLAAILGHMECLHGSLNVMSSDMGHVSHQAWVQSSSVKDNVLFGRVKDRRRYAKVMDACCLRSEVDLFSNKDKTEVGDRGILLNDSQKQRLSLARAVYSKADIYLLDHPLSDVDPKTANQVFSHVISKKGLLRKTTRLLVTTNRHWLKECHAIIFLTDGRLTETGSFESLMSRGGAFARFINDNDNDGNGNNGDGGDNGRMKKHKSRTSVNDDDDDDDGDIGEEFSKLMVCPFHQEGSTECLRGLFDFVNKGSLYCLLGGKSRDEFMSEAGYLSDDLGLTSGDELLNSTESTASYPRRFELTESTAVEEDIRERERRIREMLLAEEKSEITRVRLSVFWDYLKLIGSFTTVACLFLFLGFQAASVYSHIWLSRWSHASTGHHGNSTNGSKVVVVDVDSSFYLSVYAGTGIVQAVLVVIFSFLSSHGMTEVARRLHGQMLSRVLRSPMAFFDRMPVVHLINRFSRDVDVLDHHLPLHFKSWLNTAFGVAGATVVISYCSPLFLAVVLPVGLMYYATQRVYIPISRQLKNLESTSRTSLYTLFRDAITGSNVINTFGARDRFVEAFLEKMEKTSAFHLAAIATNRWLAVCVEMTGNLVVVATALLTVARGNTNESLVGLAVAISLQVTSGLSWLVRATTDLETNVFSVQRMREMSLVSPESPRINPFKKPQLSWPHQGAIHFFNCTTQPRADLYPALRPLNLYIEGGEKIGIVGLTLRTEALSIRDALFRIVEATSGSIIIDNTIINDIGLEDLRSRITFLPAEPVLFSGSLRTNLDPSATFTDDEVWAALEMACIKDAFDDLGIGLRFDCGENGKNLSLNQRHLVSLARALLHRRKVVVVEESRRSLDLDPHTQDVLQTALRAHFSQCTVLAFTCHINTIVDYDRVVVMSDGLMVEVDSPKNLLHDKSSMLHRLAKQANLL